MSSAIAALQAEVDGVKQQLEDVLAYLKDDPDNGPRQELKATLEEALELYQTELDEAHREQQSTLQIHQAPPPAPVPAQPEKWSRENHPAFQNKKAAAVPPAVEAAAPVVFRTGDWILARRIKGDKLFHSARILAITGSSANPLYNVKFKDTGETESGLRKEAIKPVPNDKKRKAEVFDSPVPAASASPAAGIISAGPNIDLALTQAKKEPSKVSDGPTRPAKPPKVLKGQGALKKSKQAWNDFQAKQGGRKKESMFRTGEGVNARGKLDTRHSNTILSS